MPWRTVTKSEMKEEFVKLAIKGSNISELCRRYNVSRKTGYKWLNRFYLEGISGLEERSRRPLYSPLMTSSDMVDHIIRVRLEHPFWGGRKILAYLQRSGYEAVPSSSAISNILKKHGLIDHYTSERTSHYRRFEHETPNKLWQMDFKGHFDMEGGKRCHPLDILDDHSRYILGLRACAREDRITVQSILEDVFRRYGLPDRINVDNGSPWGNGMPNTKFTALSLWLVKQGITVSYSRAFHPQTNGKIERMHRTLKNEVVNNHYYRNLDDVQKSFDRWRHIYNHERPHEGIDMQVPIDRYKPSYRPYKEKVEEYEYSKEYKLFKVDKRGRIFFNKKEIFTSTPLAGEVVGAIPTNENGIYKIFFRHQFIMNINLNDNANVLTMS